jgi:hypothetical protein
MHAVAALNMSALTMKRLGSNVAAWATPLTKDIPART